jgi:hypothetical protein
MNLDDRIRNTNSVPSLDLKLSAELAIGKTTKLFLQKKNYFYLCNRRQMLFNWWDDFCITKRIYRLQHHRNFTRRNVSQKHLCFIAKTFVGAVIANTEIFIGADSGIMHLASALDTTVGLFSRPNQVTYAPL